MNEKGQILIDSSDLVYMYDDEDLDEIKNSNKYYGEITFSIKYKQQDEVPFSWLYLDFNKLKNIANENGFECQKILEGENFDYLARLIF